MTLSPENLTALAQRIIVVVPVLNEADHIEHCLADLLSGDAALSACQIIVADGGSQDGTQRIVSELQEKWPNVSLIDNPKKLQAAGVNAGAMAASPERDILIRCDAHSAYPPRFLLDVAAKLVELDCDSVVVPMDARPNGTGCFAKSNAWIVDTPLGSGGSAHRGGQKSLFVDHGHHAAFWRARFLGLGGYDEAFSHNEDAEYDARLRADGGKIWLEAGLRIGYFPRASAKGLYKQYWGYGRGRARNIRKNGQMPRLRQLIPVIHVIALSISVLAALVIPWTLIYPLFYGMVLLLTSLAMVARHKSLCALWSGVCVGVMHLAWGSGFITEMIFGKRHKGTKR